MLISNVGHLEGHYGPLANLNWSERCLFIRSFQIAKAAETAVRERLEKTQMALESLNEHQQGTPHFTEKSLFHLAAEEYLGHYQFQKLPY